MTPEPYPAGKAAYERDLKERPRYHDGTPRTPWDELPGWAQQTWENKK